MSVRALTALALLVFASGCASLASQREHDRSDVRDVVRERLGVEIAPLGGDDGSIAPQVVELLASPLTEDSAVKVAILNNRTVRAELARLGVASAELIQAGLLSNPLLSANAKFFDGGTEIEAGLVQSFLDVFLLAARKRVQESELEATKAHVAREIVRLVHDVRRAFVHVHAARRLLEVEREILRAAQASTDLMGELHRAGNITDPELTADEVALAQAKLALARAEAASVEAREPLSVLLGLWGESVSWTVEGTLPDDISGGFDIDRVETHAIATSFDLAELRAEATAEARRGGIVGWEAALAPGDAGLAAKQESSSPDWGFGPALGFSLPLFDSGGPRRAAIAARLERVLAQHVARAVEVRSAARRLRERLVALRDQAGFIREEQMPKAKRLVRETLRNYNAMQIGVFAVFVARQQEIDAARSYVETLRAAWLARLDLEELLAGSLNPIRIEAGPAASGHASTPMGQAGH